MEHTVGLGLFMGKNRTTPTLSINQCFWYQQQKWLCVMLLVSANLGHSLGFKAHLLSSIPSVLYYPNIDQIQHEEYLLFRIWLNFICQHIGSIRIKSLYWSHREVVVSQQQKYKNRCKVSIENWKKLEYRKLYTLNEAWKNKLKSTEYFTLVCK